MNRPAAELVELSRRRRWISDGTARQIREGAGISRTEAARRVGVSAPALWHWETGRAVPTEAHTTLYGELIEALAEAIGYELPGAIGS